MATEQEFFGNDEVNVPKTDDAMPEITSEEPKSISDQNLTAEEFMGDGEIIIHRPDAEEDKLNFAERMGNDLKKRFEMAKEITAAVDNGEQTTAEGMLQIVGKVGAGSVMDFLGEAIVSAGRGLSAITPDIIEQPLKDGAVAAGHMFLNTDIGHKGLMAAKQGMEAWSEFKNENPRAARNIEAVVDIAFLAAPIKAKPTIAAAPAKPTVLGKAAESLEKKAAVQTAVKRQNYIDDLIKPEETKAIRIEQVARTEETGVLKTKVVEPTAAEKLMADEVSKIPAVNNAKTIQGNFNAISDEVAREAEALKTALATKDVPFPRKEFNAKLNEAMKRLQEHPLLVGDAQKTAERIVEKMSQITNGKKSTAANLLEARKELDAWIRSQKGPNIFDPKQENALSIAIREIRNTTNDFIESKAPTIGVKDSLKKQSTLLRAMDNIKPKAESEGRNIITRAYRNVHRVLPFRTEFTQFMATLTGIGGLGAAAQFAPFFTSVLLGGGATYALGKAAMGPKAKKTLSTLIKKTDEAIKKAKDENLIRQMRIDRAAMLEMLEISGEKLEEVNNESNQTVTD